MKLPGKWIVFRFSNYLHAAGALGMLCLLAYEFDNFTFGSEVDVLLFILFVAGFLSAIANAGINLLLLERYYPATMPHEKLWGWGNSLFVGVLIFLIILAAVSGRFYYNVSFSINYGYQMTDLLTVIFLSIVFVPAIPVLWLQVFLRKTIRRNYEAGIEGFLQKEND